MAKKLVIRKGTGKLVSSKGRGKGKGSGGGSRGG